MEFFGEFLVLLGDDNFVYGFGGNKMVYGRFLGGNN